MILYFFLSSLEYYLFLSFLALSLLVTLQFRYNQIRREADAKKGTGVEHQERSHQARHFSISLLTFSPSPIPNFCFLLDLRRHIVDHDQMLKILSLNQL